MALRGYCLRTGDDLIMSTMADFMSDDTHAHYRSFYQRQAATYREKAERLEAAGKHKAAARCWKVVERNERLAAKHQTAVDAS